MPGAGDRTGPDDIPPGLEDMAGFNAIIGYRLTQWSDGHAQLVLPLRADHLNRSGILHGAVSMAMLDVAGGYTGIHTGDAGDRKAAVTLSLSVQFIGKARPDGLLTATGRKRGGGSRIFFADSELIDADGQLVATGSGTYRVRTTAGQPA